MFVIELGISIETRAEQLEKACLPIKVTLLEMEIEVRDVQ